jgi:hypothetical protein
VKSKRKKESERQTEERREEGAELKEEKFGFYQ